MPKVRRPLIALIVLVAALVIGYLVNALSHDDSSPKSDGWHHEYSVMVDVPR